MSSTLKRSDALYRIVPAVYRTRDTGDLRAYFDASGELLDRLHATLCQRLADNFPDNPIDGSQACQDWLLPYFADLLDVRLVSPLVRGRRDEIANAVRWRQGKGTLGVVEEVAQAVGQLEVVLHEGWRRVAVTPRLDTPRIPASSFGYSEDAPPEPPSMAARHPGLPAVTVDFRCPSGAVAASSANPGAEQSTVDGDTHVWRQASFHGAPCYPGSYEDVSRRTVDFRCGDWRVGHYNPDRILLYSVPSAGFFDPRAPTVSFTEPLNETFLDQIEVTVDGGTTVYRNKTYGTEAFLPVRVENAINLGQEPGDAGNPAVHTWRFEGLLLMDPLRADSGRVELLDCAVRAVRVESIDTISPVITARNSLLRSIRATEGPSVLEYCTVLEETLALEMSASDCIFLGQIRKQPPFPDPPDRGCLRYSRITKDQAAGGMRLSAGTTRARPVMFSTQFGERGCGVLHPATPAAIRQGAEDGGEMGAYHGDYLTLLAEALVDKLQDYLPVGLDAVVVPDERLLSMPG